MADFSNDIFLRNELRKGNKMAFSFLFKLYYKNLSAYIFNLSKNKKQTEDIVQNTFLILWKNQKKIDPKKPLKNYIYKIAYNEFINEYRKGKKQMDYIEERKFNIINEYIENEANEPSKMHILALKEIDNLPEKCREVFLLHKKHGLRYKEIAEELNISVKTVETHISKALRRLRNIISEVQQPKG